MQRPLVSIGRPLHEGGRPGAEPSEGGNENSAPPSGQAGRVGWGIIPGRRRTQGVMRLHRCEQGLIDTPGRKTQGWGESFIVPPAASIHPASLKESIHAH